MGCLINRGGDQLINSPVSKARLTKMELIIAHAQTQILSKSNSMKHASETVLALQV